MITDKNILASKHTPGPWNVKLNEKMISIHTGLTDEDKDCIDPTICGIWAAQFDDVRRPQSEANARIISAAPEAIEFITDLLEAHEQGFIHLDEDQIAKAESILKKGYNP